MADGVHRGWGGAPLSDENLVQEGVTGDRDTVDDAVGLSIGRVHNRLAVLPTANVLNRLTRFGRDYTGLPSLAEANERG